MLKIINYRMTYFFLKESYMFILSLKEKEEIESEESLGEDLEKSQVFVNPSHYEFVANVNI